MFTKKYLTLERNSFYKMYLNFFLTTKDFGQKKSDLPGFRWENSSVKKILFFFFSAHFEF